MRYDVIIIGAGASGLMAASVLKNQKICLIDANETIGSKIKISGGGKCNITNKYLSYENYLGSKSFVQTLLEGFDNQALLKFLKHNNVVPTMEEKIIKGTYFCNSSKEIIEMFKKLTSSCHYRLNTKVLKVEHIQENENEEYFAVQTQQARLESKYLIVATGGLSYPSLNASSFAFDLALKMGHTLEKPNPALVGFTVQKEQFWFKELSGVSLAVCVKVEDKVCEGGLLFAHKGCSGPAILNASLYWKKGSVLIDFLPHQKIEAFLTSNKLVSSALPLPKRFIQAFLNSMALEDKPFSKLSQEELGLLKKIKAYEFSPAGNFGYTKAEVTKGGICTDEIEAHSCESKKQKRVYFIGECLDVTGELGGYNFQFAFSSAFCCSNDINSRFYS